MPEFGYSPPNLKREIVTQIQWFIDEIIDKYRLKCVKDYIVEDDDETVSQWHLAQRHANPDAKVITISTTEIFDSLQDGH